MTLSPAPLHDPLEEARRLGLDFTIADLARRMGMNERVLAHQLNPEQEFHKLGLATAIAMTEITNDNRILQAWAAARGCVCVPVPRITASEDELLDMCLGLDVAHGDFGKRLITARRDGVIDAGEFKALTQLLHRLMAQAASIQGDLAGQVRERPADYRVQRGSER